MTSDPNLRSENPIYSCLQYLHFNLPSIDSNLAFVISIYHLQIQMITSLPSGISIYVCWFKLSQFTVRNFNLPPADSNDHKFSVRNFNLLFTDSNYLNLLSELIWLSKLQFWTVNWINQNSIHHLRIRWYDNELISW